MVKKMQIIKEIQRQLSIEELQRFNKRKHQCDDVMNECFNEMKLETLNHQLYFLLPNSKVATLHCVNHFYTEFYYFLWQSIADNKSLTIISPRQLSKLDAMWTEILTAQNKEWIYRYLSKCGFDSECSGQNEDGVKLMKKFASIIVYYSILNPFEMAKMRSDYLRQFQEILAPLSNSEFEDVCKSANHPIVNTLYALIFSKKSSLSEDIKNILVRGMIQLVKAFRQ
jgi:predicted nucleic-acid-binding Zn-ribbon protein